VFGLVTTRTSQSFLITLKSLKRSRPSVECFDVVRVAFERLVAVRHRFFVLWRFHAHITRGTIAVEDGLWLRRHGDGAGVVLSGDDEISSLVRIVTLLLQRSRERLAFLLIGISTQAKEMQEAEPKGRKRGILTPMSRAWICSSVNDWSGPAIKVSE
jgi:hypothetical protein